MSSSSIIETLIAKLPKAELHVHVDGTLEADLIIKVRSPPHPSPMTVSELLTLAREGHSSLSFVDLFPLQIAERNSLTHLLPFKTLEEAKAAYKYDSLQVRTAAHHCFPSHSPSSVRWLCSMGILQII